MKNASSPNCNNRSVLCKTVFVCLFFTVLVFPQSTVNYIFSTDTSASLIQDKNGNPIDFSSEANLLSNSITYGVASNLSIGFNFYFMGTMYDKINVSVQGNVGLGTTAQSAYMENDLVLPEYTPPILAPFWDYIRTATSGHTARMKTIGTEPNRCCVIEWHVRIPASSVNTYDGVFQCRIYETTGEIEFVYGKMAIGTASSVVTASIGISNGRTDNTMVSVTNLTSFDVSRVPAGVVNNLVNSNTIGSIEGLHSSDETEAEGRRRFFRFTPYSGANNTPINLLFPIVNATGMQLKWTDNSVNETYFKVYRSANNSVFTHIGTVYSTSRVGTGNEYTYNATGLTENTKYYWRISAGNEASAQSDLLADSLNTAAASTISGVKTIGSGGDYITLTNAIADIQMKGMAGNIDLEIRTDYNPALETYPILFQNINTSASKILSIYPQTGVTNVIITSDNYYQTIDFNGQSYVVIDGRPNKTGNEIQLTVSNSNLHGSALRLYNGSSNNTFRYCDFRGVNNTNTIGVVHFGKTEINTGNSYNTIEYSKIHDGATKPNICILSEGTNSTTQTNKHNVIQNCKIYNFFYDGLNTRGINLRGGSLSWTIQNNSFYQTEPIYPTKATVMRVIEIDDYSSGNNKIYNNKIGGSSENLGGDSMFVFSAENVQLAFRGIYISTSSSATTGLNSIQGNTISRIRFQTGFITSNSNCFTALQIGTGFYAVGDTTANVIGGDGGGTFIDITYGYYYSANSKMIEIMASYSTSGIIKNNIINGMKFSFDNSTTGNLITISGIYLGASVNPDLTLTVENNRIGSLTDANAINITNTNRPIDFSGIYSVTYGGGSLIIKNNTIANILQGSTSTLSPNRINGIHSHTGYSTPSLAEITIESNTIFNFSTTNKSSALDYRASLSGIVNLQHSSELLKITKNKIHSLHNSNTSAGVYVVGIFNSDSVSSTHEVDKNLIHHLSLAFATNNSYIVGITHEGKNAVYSNNMIQLGYDINGNPITQSANIYGIWDKGRESSVYFNSIYIGGLNVAGGSLITSAIKRSDNTNLDIYKNNIFLNKRGNTAEAISHFCVNYHTNSNLTSDYNILQAGGTGSNIGYINSVELATFSQYQIATNLDLHSGNGDPNFVNPTGNATEVDLHVANPTVIEASGEAIGGITEDYDSQTRSGLTPVDIGADAGNFTVLDVIPPFISFEQLGRGNTANRVLPDFATITDNVTVSAGDNTPRLYYKKSTDANSYSGNTSADNGWKYVIGTVSGNKYSFTINYSIIFGGSVSEGDLIQYFVTAQDPTANLSSVPVGAAGQVSNITSFPTTPYSYSITPSLSGTKTIPGDYAGITTAGGLFADLNAKTLSGNLEIRITGDVNETGEVELQKVSEIGIGGEYSIKIVPSSASNKILYGDKVDGLIRLNGVQRLTIDGSYDGAGNFLTFRNINNSASVISILNDASVIKVKFCNLYGGNANSSLGIVFINAGIVTGNRDIEITDNLLGEAETPSLEKDQKTKKSKEDIEVIYTNVTGIRIQSVGQIAANNSNIKIERNYFVNLQYYGIGASGGGNNWYILNNHFYRSRSIPDTYDVLPIYLGTGWYTAAITGNRIGGSAANCGGSPYVVSGDVGFTGIYVDNSTSKWDYTVLDNIIQNIHHSNTTTTKSFSGIKCNGGNTIIGSASGRNIIGSISNQSRLLRIDGGGTTNGIWVVNTDAMIANNEVGNIVQTSESRGVISGINVEGGACVTMTNNVIVDIGPVTLTVANPSTAWANGIVTSNSDNTSQQYVTNNLVSIGDYANSWAQYAGIRAGWSYKTFICANNTVHLKGNANSSSTSSSTCSYAAYETYQNALVSITNNIFYNNRTGGAGNYAINYPSGLYANITSANNLLVTNDPNGVVYSNSRNYSFGDYKSATSSGNRDRYSMYSQANNLMPGALWQDYANWNYAPNASNSACWTLNGNGIPSSYVRYDINGNSRSSTYTAGNTDIGAWEFNTTADPPGIVGTPPPTPGGTTSFTYYSRPLIDITWSGEGAVPVTATLDFYPGTPPPNATTTNPNAEYAYQYYILKYYGGSNYLYDLTLYLDPNQKGKITNLANSKLARWTGGGWYQYTNSMICSYLYNLTTTGIAGGNTEANESVTFAIGSSDNPLPVEIASFTTKVNGRNIELNWTTASEYNINYYQIERLNPNEKDWIVIGKVISEGKMNSENEYTYIDKRLSTGLYSYRLRIFEQNGATYITKTTNAEIGIPLTFEVLQNYPNPFNPETKIEFHVAAKSHIRLELFSITGELVSVIRDEIAEAGYYTEVLNGSVVRNSLSSGIYFYRFIAVDENGSLLFNNVKKMIYLK